MILAGIDEAGYGPLLGPLVVSATAFEIGGIALPVEWQEGGGGEEAGKLPCLWRILKSAVAKKAPVRKGRVLVADSKIVHNMVDGKKLLERGVLAFLACMAGAAGEMNVPGDSGSPPAGGPGGGEMGWSKHWSDVTIARLLERCGCCDHELGAHPWYTPDLAGLPWLADPGDLAITCNMLGAALAMANVRPVAMRTAVVSEKAFNRLVDGTQNKASALVSITLRHLHYLHTHFGHLGLAVGIDKQGGRDYYTSLLLQTFPDAQLKVVMESPEGSTYLLRESSPQGSRQTLIHFREKGETVFLPTALASMLCKYLRELCMHSFNGWWCRQIEGLRPTAGYYRDGARWITDVEPHLARLGVAREMLVRIR